ncbi:hypothetical protein JCM8097_009439 [Rhodosporidiobolus ruineniae]
MLSRSAAAARQALQRPAVVSRGAATSSYKRPYTPRTPPRPPPAARTATSPSTASQAAAARPAASAAQKEAAAETADAPVAPSPILDTLPDDLEPPSFDSPALSPAPSFARKAAVAPTPSASAPAATAFPSTPAFAPAPSSAAPPAVAADAFTPAPADQIDWSTSWHGLSAAPFTREQAQILMRPLEQVEIEIKPDGLIYLPEILYRRILNKAFGPGGWGMVPRGEMTVLKNMVTREWGLVAGGRLISVARGEQTFFDPSGMPTASEGCKSNALMRCCKDLGIASELWDPVFIRAFKAAHCVEAWTEHVVSKKKQKRWRKKHAKFDYPYIESK